METFEIINIGFVTKAHGVHGDLCISFIDDNIINSVPLNKCYINNETNFVSKIRKFKNSYIVSINNIYDRNCAELLINKYLCINKIHMKLNENIYLCDDLIGLQVYLTNDNFIGKIIDVVCANTNYLRIQNKNNKIIILPLLKSLNIKIDKTSKTMVVDKKIFAEISYYED